MLGVHFHLSTCWSGTRLFVEMLNGYMLISRNVERVHVQRKFGNPCTIAMTIQQKGYSPLHWLSSTVILKQFKPFFLLKGNVQLIFETVGSAGLSWYRWFALWSAALRRWLSRLNNPLFSTFKVVLVMVDQDHPTARSLLVMTNILLQGNHIKSGIIFLSYCVTLAYSLTLKVVVGKMNFVSQ